MFLAMDIMSFAYWLQKEREIRGWSQSDLSRQSGLHRAVINKLESGTRPMPETLTALARALGISPISIFRQAGLLPSASGEEASFDNWKFLLSQLPPDEQDEMRKIAQLKIEKRQAAEAAQRAGQFKPGNLPK
jgi:transcriptional regulator with XRE-family HTH domain